MLDLTDAAGDVAVAQVRAAEVSAPHERAGRIARGWRFARTCVHAARLLPAVRRAVPWYVWPVLAVAALVKCLPLDFGTDEALFALAFALIWWRRPGLLNALYREAQSGKPAPCRCGQCLAVPEGVTA